MPTIATWCPGAGAAPLNASVVGQNPNAPRSFMAFRHGSRLDMTAAPGQQSLVTGHDCHTLTRWCLKSGLNKQIREHRGRTIGPSCTSFVILSVMWSWGNSYEFPFGCSSRSVWHASAKLYLGGSTIYYGMNDWRMHAASVLVLIQESNQGRCSNKVKCIWWIAQLNTPKNLILQFFIQGSISFVSCHI